MKRLATIRLDMKEKEENDEEDSCMQLVCVLTPLCAMTINCQESSIVMPSEFYFHKSFQLCHIVCVSLLIL